jgi:hypothetical protein
MEQGFSSRARTTKERGTNEKGRNPISPGHAQQRTQPEILITL